jgi:hypothetical protein
VVLKGINSSAQAEAVTPGPTARSRKKRKKGEKKGMEVSCSFN